jgi:hypothetical protein
MSSFRKRGGACAALVLLSVAITTLAFAADGPACTPFERVAACCPHPPVACCTPEVSTPVDDAAVVQICGAKHPKGEANGMQACKRYFTVEDVQAEVVFGRQPGDDAAFGKLRASFNEGHSRVSDLQVAGAARAFLVRTLDDNGHVESASAWARVGSEIIHVDAEHAVCDEHQVSRLLAHAIERLQPKRSQAAPVHNPS